MNHLTVNDMLRFIDGELSQSEQTSFAAHLQQCSRCQKEMQFQRALLRVAHEAPLTQPRPQFTHRVMEQVLPAKRHAWTLKILNNLGGIFAMIFVLGILGYAVKTPSLWTFSQANQPSQFTQAVQTYSNLYEQAKQFLGEKTIMLFGKQSSETSSDKHEEIFLMIFFSILVLVALDKLVLQRVTRIRA